MRRIAVFGATVVLWLIMSAGAAVRGAEPGTIGHKVEAAFNREPFEYQEKLIEERRGLRILRLTFPSPVKTEVEANNTVPAGRRCAGRGGERPAPSGRFGPAYPGTATLSGNACCACRSPHAGYPP